MKRWLLVVVVVVMLITMAEQVTSPRTERNSTLMRIYCDDYKAMNAEYFLSNLNTTLSSLRRQLTTSGYATANALVNGVSVWGLAWCRGYLSVPSCLDCFDYAVDQLKVCGILETARVIFSDCSVSYRNYNFFAEENPIDTLCDNEPIEFRKASQNELRKASKRLLLDLQIAAPRATNYYATSRHEVAADNATVYARAQCIPNVGRSVCLECLKLAYEYVFDCLPYTSGLAVNNLCFMSYDRVTYFLQNHIENIPSLLSDGHSNKKRTVIGAAVVGVSALLLALTFILWRQRWKNTGRGQKGRSWINGDAGAVYYNYRHLELATDNFCEENIIGKGGFGEVFKATLDDNKLVAVKKLRGDNAGAKSGFENEILLISRIRHRNLLRLLGWSSEGSNLLLVLEYIPNGSLDKFLWGEKRGYLSWKTRYDIILGIAKGLAHLHKEFHVRIVHRDIKSSNILLDDNFQPKIADFGLARFQPEDQSHITTKFAGTLGYTAPEYVLYGHLSDKVDTFSFGIVILEIVSGRKCTYGNFDASSTNCLLEYAWELYETKNLMKLVDESMDMNQYKEEHVMNMIEIALLCTQSPVSKRPTMSEVVVMLPNDSSFGERKLTRPNFTNHDWRIKIRSS